MIKSVGRKNGETQIFGILSYPVEYDRISIVRLEQRRDSLVIVLSGNGKEIHMNTLEILTLLLVVFAALSYLDNHHKK